MKNFPFARSWGTLPSLLNLLLYIAVMFFGPTYQLLATYVLLNTTWYFIFKGEEIRATLLLNGITQEDGHEDRK